MHDIFKDMLKGFAPAHESLVHRTTEPASTPIDQAAPDPRHIEAMLSELHLIRLERLRLQSRIVELEAVLHRIDQRMMGKTP